MLRFNTRGTASPRGTSEGTFDAGDAERFDVAAAIEFAEFHDKVGDLPVDYYVMKNVDEATARRFMGRTPRMIEFFNKVTGQEYPYPRYAQVCLPEFNGGMENTSATSMTDDALQDETQALERDFDDLFDEAVVPILGPVIYRYGYGEALADDVITPFELTNIRVPLTEDELARYNAYTKRLVPLFRERERGSPVDDRLHRILRERARVSTGATLRIPAAIRIVERHRRVRALVFHEHIVAADAIVAVLTERGHRAAAYHSGIGTHVRQDNLRRFRRGQIDVLVTCRALDEGINVPDASLAVIVASTASVRQRIQRLGRVLRPSIGKTNAQVFTIYASEPEADRLRREEEGLEGVKSVSWQTFAGAR